MTRQEQIKQQAKLLCNTVSPEEYFIMGAKWADAHPDIDVRTMAAWQSGYKEAVDKACEWLKDFIKWNDLCTLEDIEQFRKAMKGGEE